MSKFIITAAVTGSIHTPTMSSHLPITPELASLNAGSLNFALFPILEKVKDFKHDWEPPNC